jgi:transcription initiation factor TFIID subunit 5
MVVSAGEDKKVILWDLGTGKMMQELTGHTDTIRALSFSQEGSMLASGGLDNTVCLWNTKQ